MSLILGDRILIFNLISSPPITGNEKGLKKQIGTQIQIKLFSSIPRGQLYKIRLKFLKLRLIDSQ